MTLLKVSGISLEENGGPVLRNISFGQRRGQRLALAGESGAGKSSLLQLIAGLIQPGAGQVRVNGQLVRGPHETLVPGHPGVAYLTQSSELPRFLRVEQVLRYASRRPAAEAQTLFDVCRIGHLLARRTNQLSGGERQRVALARLLLGAPELLLLDEPYSNLDRGHKLTLQAVVRDVSEQLGITCLLVSHDAADVLAWADEILVLRRGELVQQGRPEQVYRQPVDEYTAGLFGDYNLLRGAERAALGPDAAGWPVLDDALLLRPEQLRLAPAGGGGLPGVVRAVRFAGSYYEVEVLLAATAIRVRVAAPDVAPGAVVHVSAADSAQKMS